jgi:hypothetical protein
MAVRDMVTHSVARLISAAAISANGTTEGAIIDTADFDLGVSFYMTAPTWTDGVFKLVFVEGDDLNPAGSAITDGIPVIADKIIPILDPAQDAVVTGIVAVTAEDGLAVKAGLHSTHRYVQANIVATGVTAGATINLVAMLGAELIPA